MMPTTRSRLYYTDRANHFFEDYLKRQAYIDDQEKRALEKYRNEGAASYALKHDDGFWQYREACVLRDRDMAVVTMSALMALIAGGT
jgi:hypothetical protein